jgi:ubiquinone biosynthesis protein COQ9
VLVNQLVLLELHQLTSPETAEDFLDDLLKSSDRLGSTFQGTAQYLEFIGRSWVGIIKSSGVL